MNSITQECIWLGLLGVTTTRCPANWRARWRAKRVYPERIEVVFDEAVVASHLRLFERTQTRYDRQHYLLVESQTGVAGEPVEHVVCVVGECDAGAVRVADLDEPIQRIVAVMDQARRRA